MDPILEMRPLPPEAWDDRLADILDDMRGRPLNIHRMLAHHPELLLAWWPFRNYSVRGGTLSARDRELVILRVAHRLDSAYEWDSHVERGHSAGLTLEEIHRVRRGPDDDGWDATQSALLQAVDDCVDDCRILPATLARLRAHYDNRQVLDIIGIQSMYQMLGAVIGTWGLELDPFVQLPEGYQR